LKTAPPPHDEDRRLASLRALRVLDSLPEREYDDLVHLASTICGTPIALISLIDEGRQWFKARLGLAAVETPREVAFCAHAILEPDRTFVVGDARADERFHDNPLVTGDPHVRFYAGAPLRAPDGHPLGTICVIDRVPRELTPDQTRALEALARQVTSLLALRVQAVELQEANRRFVELRALTDDANERVAAARRQSEERLAAQYAMARVLAEASTLEEAAPRLLETLCTSGRWDLAVVWETDESDAILRCAAAASVAHETPGAIAALQRMVAHRGEGIAGKVWVSGESIWVEDALQFGEPGIVAKAQVLGMRAVLSVPVTVEGKVIGVVNLFGHAPRASDEPTRSLAEALSAQIGSFLTRKRTEVMQRRMVTVLENTSDFVVITTRRGEALYLNRAGRAMLEVPPDADLRQFKTEDYLPPWALTVMRGALSETARREGRWTGEFAYLSASGREIPVSQVTIAPKGPDGVTLFYASVARDVTEAKKVERMKNEFVSTVSHELRTPLTSIRGALGLLEAGVMGPLEESTLEIVRIARTNSERLIRLINDMLDLEKIEAGKLEMVLRDVGAEALVESAVDSVRGTAEQAGVTVAIHLEPDLRAHVDVDRVVQVLTNLLSNAIKFSPRGGAVTLRARACEERARFEIVDRGPGIPPELRARLFQKFQQLDASDARAKGGTGLGLSISKAIVEQHGGAIGVDSTPGEGATFWFEIARVAPVRRSIPPRVDGSKVLIVDDDPSIRAVLTRLIETMGVRVLHAADGAIAVNLARTEAPDLIVLDLGMPRPDGFEVVSILQDDVARTTPLLVYTARELSPADRAALRLGDTRYLTKSRASEATLLATVRELLGRPPPTG
jgi:PAS domain S-box-containing protein